jgi:hypothetical protein
MTFIGYCTTKQLAKFLDFGSYETYTIDSYDRNNDYTIPTTSDDGITGYLIEDTIKITEDGVIFNPNNYSVDLDTGAIKFNTHPEDASEVKVIYYLNSTFSNDDLESYIELGAYELEEDTRQIFRELSVTDYTTDINETDNYISYDMSDKKLPNNYRFVTTIYLPYAPILSVSSLEVDGTDVTPSTLKIRNNCISLTSSSEVGYFPRDADSIVISFKYGITSIIGDRTETDRRLIKLACEANKYSAIKSMLKNPNGRNAVLENSKAVSLSGGQIRPDTIPDNMITQVNERYDELVSKLKAFNSILI